MPPRLTVITATYNKGSKLSKTVDSILGQTMRDFDYVVINDESTDETAEVLAEFDDDRLQVIHQENKGFSITMETALRNIATPYVAIQGAGDASRPERLEKQLRYLEAHEEVVVVGCDREDRDVAGNLVKASSQPFRRLSGPREAVRRNILNHGEVMFRTSAYRRAGGYRPFFKYAQDRDLWLRMVKYGDIVSLPELLYTRITDPRTDVSGNPQRTCAQAKFSQYAVYLAQGDLEGRWNNETLNPAERYEAFVSSLGRPEKRAIARRICSQIRAMRMPPAEELKRLETTVGIMAELVPGSWMAREIALRKMLIDISPTLFRAYFGLSAGWTRMRRNVRARRGASPLPRTPSL